MRLFSFSLLKNTRFKLVPYQAIKKYSNNSSAQQKTNIDNDNGSLIDICPTWPDNVQAELRMSVLQDMRVVPDFVTEAEESQLMTELEPYLKKMRYEFDHWDNAIHGFRETERSKWKSENEAVMSRLRLVAQQTVGPQAKLLSHMHVLDLAAAGHIKPHIDAVRFCGGVIAGVCLLSTAVMRLQHHEMPELTLDTLLPRRCLYIMSGVARYSFTHAVLGGEESVWRGERLHKRRRVSLICRSEPDHSA